MGGETTTLTIVLNGDGTKLTGVVNGGVDSVKKLGNAADDAGKRMQDAGGKIERVADGIRDTLKDLAAAVGAAFSVDKIVEWVNKAIDGAARIGALSQVVGISTQSLQAMSYAAGLTETSLDTLTESIARMERASLEARDGNKQTAAAFKAVGVSIDDIRKLNPDQLFQKVAKGIAGMQDGSVKTAVAMALMGRGAAENIPFVNLLGQNFDALKAKAAALGIVLSTADQQALVSFKEQTNELGQEVKGLGNEFAIALLPALTAVVGQIQRAAESGEFKAYLMDAAAAAAFLADHLDAIVVVAKTLVEIKVSTWAIEGAKGLKEMAVAGNVSVTSLSKIGIAQGVLAAAFAGWNIGTYLSENFQIVRTAGILMVQFLLIGFENLQAGGKILWLELQKGASSAFASIKSNFSILIGGLSNFALLQGNFSMAKQFADLSAQLKNSKSDTDQYDASIRGVKADYDKNVAAIKENISGMLDYNASQVDATAFAGAHAAAIEKKTQAAGKYNTQVDASIAREQALAKATTQYQAALNELIGKLGGPYTQNMAEYANAVLAARTSYDEMVKSGMSAAKAQDLLNARVAAATSVFHLQDEELRAQNDLLAKSALALSDQEALWGVLPEKLDAVKAGQDAYNQAMATHKDLLGTVIPDEGKLKDALAAQIPVYVQNKQALNDVTAAQKNNEEINKQWVSIASSGFDSVAGSIAQFATGGIKSWKDFGKALMDDTKQFIAAIIQQFLKLTVFNGIINSLFGLSGSSALPTGLGNGLLGQLLSGGSSGGGGITSVLTGGGGAGGSSAAGTGGGFSLFSPSSWVDAGKNLYTGFTSLFGSGEAATAGQLGDFSAPYAGTNFAGGTEFSPGYGVDYGAGEGFNATTAGTGVGTPSYGGYGSALGQGIGIAGGIYAGVNEFKNAGGGVAGLAGAAAYGVGTYFAGAAASAALSGGIAAGMAAIPVVGWIALVAMLIDKFSGGKLFGTAYQTKASTQTLSIGPDGGEASAYLSQSKQGALFSGTKWRQKSVDAGPDAQSAADQFYQQEKDKLVAQAKALGTEVVPVLAASIDTITQYDKKGHATSTKYMVDVIGKQWEETTVELAAMRVDAEETIAQIDASAHGEATKIADQWRDDAQKLADGAQFLLAAQVDINKQQGLLGKGVTSLADVATIVQQLQQSGETLLQTYGRLQAEQTLVSTVLDQMGLTTGKTGAAFVQLADDMSTAAGGLQNLSTLWTNFYQEFFSAAEQSSQNIVALQKSATDQLTAIGEDPTESLAKFRADFEAALPTLTGDQIVQWLNAAQALYTVTTAITKSADDLIAAKEKYAAFEIQLSGDQFISSMAQVIANEEQQINTANALAIAAGKAGASQQDLAEIITAGSLQMRQALAQLTAGIQSDIVAIYGAPATQDVDPGGPFAIYAIQQQNAAAAAQKQAQSMATAYDLIEKLGDYSFVSGKNAADTLAQFGLSPGQLAATLGVSPDQINQDIKAAADNAAALVKLSAQSVTQTGLLADILDAIQGLPLSFDVTSLIPQTAQAAVPGKLTNPNLVPAPTAPPPASRVVIAAPSAGTAQPGNSSSDSTLAAIPATLQKNSDTLMDRLDKLLGRLETFRQTMDRHGFATPVRPR